jgi:hypothetical protein
MDKIGIRSWAILTLLIILMPVEVDANIDTILPHPSHNLSSTSHNDEIKPKRQNCMAKCAESCRKSFKSTQGYELCLVICITIKCTFPKGPIELQKKVRKMNHEEKNS